MHTQDPQTCSYWIQMIERINNVIMLYMKMFLQKKENQTAISKVNSESLNSINNVLFLWLQQRAPSLTALSLIDNQFRCLLWRIISLTSCTQSRRPPPWSLYVAWDAKSWAKKSGNRLLMLVQRKCCKCTDSDDQVINSDLLPSGC